MGQQTRRLRRVLIVGDFASVTGGQAKVAIDSARLLADHGVQVLFFAACGPVSELLDHPGIRVICLDQKTILDDPNRLRAMASGVWNAAALRALREVTRQMDPRHDVIHCHGYAKALSPAIGRELAGGPLRVVFTMHEYFLACPNGGFFDYRRQQICTRRPLGMDCLRTNCDMRHFSHKAWRVTRGVAAATLGRLPRGLRDVISISQMQRRVMAPYLPADVRLHQVSNPIETGGARVRAAENRTLLFVGRLSPEKGALHLAQAARALDMPVTFVGDGPQAEAIRAANPDARLAGWISPAEVQDHLSQARALVFPSLWYEGQPLSPIEALLRGVPVVCGSWSAATESVQDGRNGLIYRSPDAQALAQALRRLPELGDFDSSELARHVSPRTHLSRLVEIYEGMLAA